MISIIVHIYPLRLVGSTGAYMNYVAIINYPVYDLPDNFATYGIDFVRLGFVYIVHPDTNSWPRTQVNNAPICDLPDNLAANGIHTIRFYMHYY